MQNQEQSLPLIRGRRPIASHLWVFALSLLLPSVALSFYVVERGWHQQSARSEARVVQLAVDLADDVSAVLERNILLLRALSLSASLAQNDLIAFRGHAIRVLEGTTDALFLIGPDGKQLVNTIADPGHEYPLYGNSEALAQAISTRQPVVSNLFIGNTRKNWVINILHPVLGGAELAYVLVLSISADRFKKILEGQQLEGDWASGLSDVNSILIARSRQHEDFVGRSLTSDLIALGRQERKPHVVRSIDGRMIVRATARTRVGGWTASVGIGKDAINADANASLRDVTYVAAVLFLISFAFIGWQAARISSSIRSLASLSKTGSDSNIREVFDAARLIEQSMAALRERDETLRLALSAFCLQLGHRDRPHQAAVQQRAGSSDGDRRELRRC